MSWNQLRKVRGVLANKKARIALVGASAAPHKYGNIILRDLSGRGYEMLPVNPRAEIIEGLPCYGSLAEIHEPVDIINLVVPPDQARAVVAEADPSLCEIMWFQPGSFDDEVLQLATSRFPTVLAGDCIMVVARQV